MGLALIIILGAAVGWIFAIGRCIDNSECIALNVVAGAVGAVIASLVSHAVMGTSDILAGNVGVGSLIASVFGALVTVTAVHIVREVTPAR